jgi:hypothetical protein
MAYRYRGNFYNATQRTVQGLTGAIFQKPPEVKFPEAYKEYLDDITLGSVNFEMFANEAGREVMTTGRFGVLVDMQPEGTVASSRPYCVGYIAEDIINWRTECRGGDEVLTLVVVKELKDVPSVDDPYVATAKAQYRSLEIINDECVTTVWVQDPKDPSLFTATEVMRPSRRGIPLDFIPFVFIGTTHATPDLTRPPLLDLADINLGHWRNSVDHEYGLHLVALPTPWVAGSKGAGGDVPMKIGPSVVWELTLTGSAGMLEFSGKGLEAIVTAMESKQAQMATLGARLLETPGINETATAVLIRHSGDNATLRTIAGAIEQAFTTVLQTVLWWVGTAEAPSDLEEEVEVELNKDYVNVRASPQEIQAALASLQEGKISYATWWNLIQTGGWGREGIDADAEQTAIEADKAKAKAAEPTPAVPQPVAPTPPKRRTVLNPDGTTKLTIVDENV